MKPHVHSAGQLTPHAALSSKGFGAASEGLAADRSHWEDGEGLLEKGLDTMMAYPGNTTVPEMKPEVRRPSALHKCTCSEA